MKNIGVWMSDKKSQKINWKELMNACETHGCTLQKISLDSPLEEQGSFDVFLHKLTDIIAASDLGDPKARDVIGRLEQYLSNHPEIIVIDPLDNVRILLNRYRYYTILSEEISFKMNGIFTPPFAELLTTDWKDNVQILKTRGLNFPLICKPNVAHGSKSAHEMILIFNERGLKSCKPPCVLQNFVNHNAVLHKVFVVGNRYHICERPSLKNFQASESFEPIFYSTGEVCKADSQSTLSVLDPHDKSHAETKILPSECKIRHIIRILQKHIGLLLFGFDVVIDNVTGDHAVIDINVYPSYDNFPNFFDHLLGCINDAIKNNDLINENCTRDHGESLSEKQLYSSLVNGLLNVGKLLHNPKISEISITD